jgi:hypothetical protein
VSFDLFQTVDAWAERVSCRLLACVDAALEQQIREVAQRSWGFF